MTSITHLRTAMSPRVMPPKQDAKPLAPKLTPEQDAALCMARARKRDGSVMQFSGVQPKTAARHARQASERQTAIHQRILATLANGEATGASVAAVLNLHVDTVGGYLRAMVNAGMINREILRGGHVYSLPRMEAAE